MLHLNTRELFLQRMKNKVLDPLLSDDTIFFQGLIVRIEIHSFNIQVALQHLYVYNYNVSETCETKSEDTHGRHALCMEFPLRISFYCRNSVPERCRQVQEKRFHYLGSKKRKLELRSRTVVPKSKKT